MRTPEDTATPRRGATAIVTLLALPLIAIGCGETDAAVETATVRDSAGVRIVESSAPAWSATDAVAVPAEPTLAIGEEEAGAEYQFGRVAAATRLADGGVAVFDGMANELRVFDAEGRFVRRTGGRGGGPGEYQFVSWMRRLPGDSLVLHDVMAQRITVLAPDGAVARSVNLAAAGASDLPAPEAAGRREGRVTFSGLGRYRVLAPFADGSLLATVSGTPSAEEGRVTRDSVVYVRLGPDGAVRDTLGTFVGDEMQTSSAGDGERRSMMFGPPPFGRSTQVAADGDGFWLGTSDRYEIGRYDAAGRLVRVVRRPLEPTPITEADVAERKRLDLENAGGSDAAHQAMIRRMVEARWEKAVIPATMPAHGPLMVGGDGRLWVRETAPPADETPRWTAFAADGAMLGTVALPARFRALEFGADYVLGVRRDDLDVERVELYPLRPARAGAGA